MDIIQEFDLVSLLKQWKSPKFSVIGKVYFISLFLNLFLFAWGLLLPKAIYQNEHWFSCWIFDLSMIFTNEEVREKQSQSSFQQQLKKTYQQRIRTNLCHQLTWWGMLKTLKNLVSRCLVFMWLFLFCLGEPSRCEKNCKSQTFWTFPFPHNS